MAIASVNPATNETVKSFAELSREETESKINIANDAFLGYRRLPFKDRAAMMSRAADILEQEKIRFGSIMTTEMGKPLRAAVEEAAKCAWVCRFYAENAAGFLSDEMIPTSGSKSFIRYEPLGVILAVMPWNFPFWQVFRFAAPALMAGNAALLKHASNVPQSALAIEEVFLRAGFQPGIFQTLLIGADAVPGVIGNKSVKGVTLTGSEFAGRSVAGLAGKAIKKTVLELGGSDPFIVMPSADIEEAVKTAVRARTINNGQSCIAAKRFIVHGKVFEEFSRLFVKGMEELKICDPMLDDCDIGPLATPAILEELDNQVESSVNMGAVILTGGKRIDRPGNYYQPTILTGIPESSPAYSEELFGPVATLYEVGDIKEALRLANHSDFGLGASAWTKVEAEKERFMSELDAGSVFINGMVVSDPRLPFGGIKNSGYGRELGAYGIREFVNIKTVWVK